MNPEIFMHFLNASTTLKPKLTDMKIAIFQEKQEMFEKTKYVSKVRFSNDEIFTKVKLS